MRHQSVKGLFLIGLSMMLLSGCEREIPAMQETGSSAIEVVEAEKTETEAESAPDLVLESVDANQVTEEVPDLRATYESSFGYLMKYDKDVFEYNQHGGYDEFVMKTKAFSSDPLVFFAAMRIGRDELAKVKAEIFDAEAVSEPIGTEPYDALVSRTRETLEKGKYTQHHETFMVELERGDALLFEIQWFEGEGAGEAGGQLQQMLDSIQIRQDDKSGGEAVSETETVNEIETDAETAGTAAADERTKKTDE